jgi:hypothetical protein
MGHILLDILPDDKKPWVALAIGVAAIAFVMFKPKRRFGSPARAGCRDPLAIPSSLGSLSQQRSVERQMQNLLVELSEMSRQISGQLDTRATKLELLIKEADEKLDQLRHAPASASAVAGDTQRGAAATSFHVGEQQSFVFANQSPPAAAAAPTIAPMGPRMSLTYSAADEPDPRHAQIYTLADQGRGPKEIAATLGRPSGEIELILALRPRRAS